MKETKFKYGKCPICYKEKIFLFNGNIFLLKPPIIKHNCSACSYVYEKESGYFIGALYISYGLTVLELIILYVIIQFFTENVWGIFPFMFSFLILLSFFNFRTSRIIWISIFNK